MSVFQEQVKGLEGFAFKITVNTAVTLVDATDNAWQVPWLQVNENASGTPAMTLDLYDGTTSYCIGAGGFTWKAKAFTALQSVIFSEGIIVPKNWLLRITSGDAAGKFDVIGTKVRRV